MHFFLLLLFITIGCEKRDPNPELKDGVYQILSAEIDNYQKASEKNKKELEDAAKKLYDPLTPKDQRVGILKDMSKSRASLSYNNQRLYYYSIRRNEWAKQVRIKSISKSYDPAGDDDRKYYQINQSLRNAPRDWAKRQPASAAPPPKSSH